MTIDNSCAVRCNFRNVQTVSDLCDMDDSNDASFDLAIDWATDDEADDCLERLRDCPPGTLELMCRVFRDSGREPYEAFSELFSWWGEGRFFYFDITTKTRSNMFSVGDRLEILTLTGTTPVEPLFRDVSVSTFKGLDARQRRVTGTIWWKFSLPDGGHLIDRFPFASLFKFEELEGGHRADTVFKHCTVKVGLDDSWTRVPVKVGRITWKEEWTLIAHLDVMGGPKLKGKIHEISWEYTN
ncbi:hypothetical protein HK104_001176 [Borealophlyctis nickersoniae]|nr:hypothetical protein HK104_001176 [Borealophlyctis nickersoniae]